MAYVRLTCLNQGANPKQTHSASVSVCLGKKFASNRYFLADRSNFFAIAAAVNCKYSFHTVCTAAEAAFAVADSQCIVVCRSTPRFVGNRVRFSFQDTEQQ